MIRFEKRLVNRKKKAEGNIKKIQHCLKNIEIKKINNALELGCGAGFVSSFLSETYSMNTVGIDIDPEQINLAKKIHTENNKLHFSVGDATKLGFKDSHFDMVVSHNVFHHIPDWEMAVHQIARVLRSPGYFIWLDIVFTKVIKKIFQPVVKNYGLYTFGEVKSAFDKNGFTELFHERLVHVIFKSHHMMLKKE